MTDRSVRAEFDELRDGGIGPLYGVVKDYVRGKIVGGEWPPNFRVPSENEIVVQLGVSRMTANRALRELFAEGLITRVPGVGSFVAAPKSSSALFDVRNIADEIHDRGHSHGARIVLKQLEPCAQEHAGALQIEVGIPVFHSVIVHSENGLQIQLEDRFVRLDAAPHYLDQDFTAVTPNAYLTSLAPITRSEQSVEATMPQPWEAKLLNIPRSEPCLMIRRRTWSGQQNVTSVRLLSPSSRYRLESKSG